MNNYLRLIKFAHTIFALPFALLGFFLGIYIGGTALSWQLLLLVVLCMVFARSAAMSFNRYADRAIDSENVRTKFREIPEGRISPQKALIFTILNALAFIVCTYFINSLCFILSPVALVVVLGYSFTKRFTAICHLFLGLGLSLAPVGAYLAVTAQFHPIPIALGFVVLFWVAGFDIIYALQDEVFDRKMGLYSIPAAVGAKGGLTISRLLHFTSAATLIVTLIAIIRQYEAFSWISAFSGLVFISLLIYQQSLVGPKKLNKINLAFFTANGYASIFLCMMIVLDIYI